MGLAIAGEIKLHRPDNGFDSLPAVCYNVRLVSWCVVPRNVPPFVAIHLKVVKTGRTIPLSGIYVYIGINVKLR